MDLELETCFYSFGWFRPVEQVAELAGSTSRTEASGPFGDCRRNFRRTLVPPSVTMKSLTGGAESIEPLFSSISFSFSFTICTRGDGLKHEFGVWHRR